MIQLSDGRLTNWLKYSEYVILTTKRGVRRIVPKEGSASIVYDPAANFGALSAAIAGGREVHLGDRDAGVLMFARAAGLPGVLAEYASNNYTVPEGDGYMPAGTYHQGVLEPEFFEFGEVKRSSGALLSGRPELYNVVFSSMYSESVDDVANFLEMLYLRFTSSAPAEELPLDSTSLRTMLTCFAEKAKAAGCLHVCASCGKVYYDEDPESETCSITCRNQNDIDNDRIWFNPEPVGGG